MISVKKFRQYIEGHPFTIITDHSSLQWLMRQQDLNGRLARWSIKLQAFDIDIRNEKAVQNVVPDALSRVDCDSAKDTTCFENDDDYQEIKNKILKESEKYPML